MREFGRPLRTPVALATSLWLVAVLTATLLAAVPAAAQSQEPTLDFGPSRGPAGTVISFSGRCDQQVADSQVSVTLVEQLDEPIEGRWVQARVTTDASGAYQGRLTVPLDYPIGGYDVRANCWEMESPELGAGTFQLETGCRDTATRWWDWGGVVDSGLSATTYRGQFVDVFAVAGGGRLYERHGNAEQATWPWTSRGRPDGVRLSGTPGATMWRYGTTLNVYVRGDDGAVWQTFRQYGSWKGWTSIGGIVDSGIATVSPFPERLDVFATRAGRLYQRTYADRAWGPWRNLGRPAATGLTADAPGAVAWNGGHINVYARGDDGAIWQRFQRPDGTYSAWTSLGGVLATGPAAASGYSGRVDVVAVAPNGALYRKTWRGAWGGWTYHGAPSGTDLAEQPGALAVSTNRIMTFTPLATGAVVRGDHQCLEGVDH